MTASTATQPISSLSLSDLKETFGLIRDRTDPFFQHWLDRVALLSDYEHQALARLKLNYENIIETNPLEEVVKLVVVAPLLDLAGFYQPPFSIRTEDSTRLIVPEGDRTFTGSIDVLVVQKKFWILVIESKQSRFDVMSGIPQALSYMLAQPPTAQTSRTQAISDDDRGEIDRFGLVTNGREVMFLKLSFGQQQTQGETDRMRIYSQSRVYQVIETEEDLTKILQGLKAIGQRLQSHLANDKGQRRA